MSRVASLTLTDKHAVRPTDFDLAQEWQKLAADIDQLRTQVTATIQTSAETLEGLAYQFGADLAEPLALASGIFEVELGGISHDALAERLAGWGSSVVVTGPEEVRKRLAEIGAELVSAYSSGGQGSEVGSSADGKACGEA